jgi:hypothetical protein
MGTVHLEGQKGGVEQKAVIPILARRSSLCVHGLLQCNALVAIENKP